MAKTRRGNGKGIRGECEAKIHKPDPITLMKPVFLEKSRYSTRYENVFLLYRYRMERDSWKFQHMREIVQHQGKGKTLQNKSSKQLRREQELRQWEEDKQAILDYYNPHRNRPKAQVFDLDLRPEYRPSVPLTRLQTRNRTRLRNQEKRFALESIGHLWRTNWIGDEPYWLLWFFCTDRAFSNMETPPECLIVYRDLGDSWSWDVRAVIRFQGMTHSVSKAAGSTSKREAPDLKDLMISDAKRLGAYYLLDTSAEVSVQDYQEHRLYERRPELVCRPTENKTEPGTCKKVRLGPVVTPIGNNLNDFRK